MERRAFSRAAYTGESFPSEIVNLSLGGALVRAAVPTAEGDWLEVGFSDLVGARTVAVRWGGRVVRRQGALLGVRFERVGPKSLRNLRDILTAHGADHQAVGREYRRLAGRGS